MNALILSKILIFQRTSQERSQLQSRINTLTMLKVGAGFTERSPADFRRATSTRSALAMVGGRSSSNPPGATKQIASLNDQKTSWMRKTQVFSGSLPKGFELPATTLIMEKEERRGTG